MSFARKRLAWGTYLVSGCVQQWISTDIHCWRRDLVAQGGLDHQRILVVSRYNGVQRTIDRLKQGARRVAAGLHLKKTGRPRGERQVSLDPVLRRISRPIPGLERDYRDLAVSRYSLTPASANTVFDEAAHPFDVAEKALRQSRSSTTCSSEPRKAIPPSVRTCVYSRYAR